MIEDEGNPDLAQEGYDPTATENSSRFVTPLYSELQDFLQTIGYNPMRGDDGNPITDMRGEAGIPPSETAVAPEMEPAPPPSETAVSSPLLSSPPPSETAVVSRLTQPTAATSSTPRSTTPPSATPSPAQRQTAPAAREPEGGMLSRLFGGQDYQSNNRPVIENGQINWGNPDNPVDFVRASAAFTAMMKGHQPQSSQPQSGQPRTQLLTEGVDPRLTHVLREASSFLPSGYTMDITSGHRKTGAGFHPRGLAADVVIKDPDGNKLPNYQDARYFDVYEKFARAARKVQQDLYPELGKALRWGGYFSGPKGEYGALDLMHFDLGGERVGMGGGTWEAGLTPEQRRLWGIPERAEGGRVELLQDKFPTHYLPNVGRQVMNKGGAPVDDDTVKSAFQLLYELEGREFQPAPEQKQPEPMPGLQPLDEMSAQFGQAAEPQPSTMPYSEQMKNVWETVKPTAQGAQDTAALTAAGVFGAPADIAGLAVGARELLKGRVPSMEEMQLPGGSQYLEQRSRETGKLSADPSGASQVGGFLGSVVADPFAAAGKLKFLAAIPMAGKAADAAQAVNLAKRELTPLGLYSHGEEMARALPQERGTPEQFAGMLAGSKYGVKPVELEGFKEAFAGKPQITREEAAQYFRQNMPQIEESYYGSAGKYPSHLLEIEDKIIESYKPRMRELEQQAFDPSVPQDIRYSATNKIEELRDEMWAEIDRTIPERDKYLNPNPAKYSDYTLPGGKNYREITLKAPVKTNDKSRQADELTRRMNAGEFNSLSDAERQELFRERDALYRAGQMEEGKVFISGHWEDPNVIAHIRLSDRTIPSEGFAVRNKRSGNSSDTFATQQQAEEYLARLPASMQPDMAIVAAPGKPQKVLHVEELQSDWAQAGRKEGFAQKLDPKILSQLGEEQTSAMFKMEDARQSFNDIYENIFKDSLKNVFKDALTEHDLPNALKRHDEIIKSTHPQKRFEEYRSNFLRAADNFSPEQRSLLQDAYDAHFLAKEAYEAAKNKRAEYASSSKGLPSNPYVTNTQAWTDLALKRVLNEAAKGGYDKIVWTPGVEQAKRYDLSKQISEVRYDPNEQILYAYDHNGSRVMMERGVEPNQIDDYIGKEPASKLREQVDNSTSILDEYDIVQNPEGRGWVIDLYGEPLHEYGGGLMTFGSKSEAQDYLRQKVDDEIMANPPSISGLDLQVGGEGMKGYYDKIVPTQLQKLTKKLDPEAKIGKETIGSGMYEVVLPNGKVIAEYREKNSADIIARKSAGATVRQNAIEVPSLTITPKMRENILRGLAAYADGGAVDDNQTVNRALEMTRHFGSHM